VQELTGMEGEIITLQEIFSFNQTGIDEAGKVRGNFKFHGVRPKFMDRFKAAGIEVSNDIFDPSNSLEI
jgi:pilus assembly protein CpaF